MIRGFSEVPAPTSEPGVQIDDPLAADSGVQISLRVAETPTYPDDVPSFGP